MLLIEIIIFDDDLSTQEHHWCSGNINAFQAFALGSIPGWCRNVKMCTSLSFFRSNITFGLPEDDEHVVFSRAWFLELIFCARNVLLCNKVPVSTVYYCRSEDDQVYPVGVPHTVSSS